MWCHRLRLLDGNQISYTEVMIETSPPVFGTRFSRQVMLRRLAPIVLSATVLLITCMAYAIWGHMPLVREYDAAFLKLEAGDPRGACRAIDGAAR